MKKTSIQQSNNNRNERNENIMNTIYKMMTRNKSKCYLKRERKRKKKAKQNIIKYSGYRNVRCRSIRSFFFSVSFWLSC